MSARELIERWVELFNAGDVGQIMELYGEDASLHVKFAPPVEGRAAIQGMFEAYFAAADLHCLIEHLSETTDGAVVLEWRDRVGLPGVNIYEVEGGRIKRQRNYFDQLTFFRLNGLPIPTE